MDNKIYTKMKKRNLFIVAFIICNAANLQAQESNLMLKEYISAALNNKANIKALKIQSEIEALKTSQFKSNYLPQLTVAYDNIYNPIIRSSIVPVGKFNPIPTDEVRAIKFGTNWQQNAGINVFQPLFNATINSKIAESKIQEKIKQTDVKIANEEIVFEVSKTYINAFVKQQQVKENATDTLRTFQNLSLLKNRFTSGKILKTEVNRAQINHNNSVEIFKSTITSWVQEKIYLGFLTGFKYDQIAINENDTAINEQNLDWINSESQKESIAAIEQLNNKIDLSKIQQKSENSKRKPTVGINGYIGADQFQNNFNPFANNSWYGNSFVGLSVRLPILLSENTSNKKNQLELQMKSYSLQKDEIINEVEKNKAIALNEISKLKSEYKTTLSNVNLYKESLQIVQERLKQGKATAYEVTNEELEFQKENQKLTTRKSAMWLQWLVVLKSSGLLNKLYN